MQNIQFLLCCTNHRWFNTILFRRRHFDGQSVSMQQSGTHWLLHMLSLCMAEVYGKEPPADILSSVAQTDAIVRRWTKSSISCKPWEHLRWAILQPTAKKRNSELHHYVQPCRWVEECWG